VLLDRLGGEVDGVRKHSCLDLASDIKLLIDIRRGFRSDITDGDVLLNGKVQPITVDDGKVGDG
jgi:hypothetical protein